VSDAAHPGQRKAVRLGKGRRGWLDRRVRASRMPVGDVQGDGGGVGFVSKVELGGRTGERAFLKGKRGSSPWTGRVGDGRYRLGVLRVGPGLLFPCPTNYHIYIPYKSGFQARLEKESYMLNDHLCMSTNIIVIRPARSWPNSAISMFSLASFLVHAFHAFKPSLKSLAYRFEASKSQKLRKVVRHPYIPFNSLNAFLLELLRIQERLIPQWI